MWLLGGRRSDKCWAPGRLCSCACKWVLQELKARKQEVEVEVAMRQIYQQHFRFKTFNGSNANALRKVLLTESRTW